MSKTGNTNLTGFSRRLRRDMTKEEKHLWYDFLKSLPVTVHRQKVIGNYIADFYIAESKLIVELDGWQHYENDGVASDMLRDEFFGQLGITVLRYSNADINQRFSSVCDDIYLRLFQES